jgi:hypothetical protein
LPQEDGVFVWPAHPNRGRFTPDGRTLYIGTARADYTDEHSYVYAIDTSVGLPELPPPCVADMNADGSVNSNDLFAFVDDYFAGNADFNGDGSVDSNDYFAFLTAYFEGC